MPSNPDVRWRQRFGNFHRAFARLSEAAALAAQRDLSDLERQGLIQAYEFTHELAWKTLKDYLIAAGSTARLHGSRDATREAFSLGLIENGDAWMRMIDDRNETTHAYDEATVNKIATAILTRYVEEFARFQQRFQELEQEAP
jgi:nucleotidyltransferase substrate binding protein (TIGR01987 family)